MNATFTHGLFLLMVHLPLIPPSLRNVGFKLASP